jgi:ectoine hydroxylase-related dioxygenase (phytanoyl-CoA dioxygenase family)
VLDTRQRQAFDRDGFLNLGPIFSPDELKRIGEEYDRLVTLEAQVLGNEEEGVFPYRAMLNFRSPELKRMITHPRLLEIAAELLGPDVRFWWDQGINKSPGAGSTIAWHQDNGYTEGRIPEYLTCWLALDPADLENGGLQVISGSHRSGQHEHEMQGVHAVIASGTIDVDDAVALDAAAGDLLIFSSLLVHQTVGNRTRDRQRRAWVVQYCAGDQQNLVTGEVYDNRPWVVRNGVALEAPVVERRFDLRRNRA